MPAFMTLYDESIDPPNRDFYAPGFELRIDGVGLPQGVLRDVMEVTYHDDINEIDGFELTVNNWDAAARRCKYIGSETAAQLERRQRAPTRSSPCSIRAARAPSSPSAIQRQTCPAACVRDDLQTTVAQPESIPRERAAGADRARLEHSAAVCAPRNTPMPGRT